MRMHGSKAEEAVVLSTARSEHSLRDATTTPVEVLFLTGQPGSGKTALAKELSELLWQCREPHAVIDLDELCRGVLPTPTVKLQPYARRCQSHGGVGKLLRSWGSATDRGPAD